MTFANSTKGEALMGLGERPGADMTSRLLLALTALYVERPTHTAQEQQQYAELALRLIPKVDAETRATVAGILRPHPDAPREVFEKLDAPPPSGAAREPVQSTAVPVTPAAAAPSATPAGPLASSEFGEAFFAASAAARRELLSGLAAAEEAQDEAAALAEAADDEHRYDGLDAAAMQGRIAAFTREFERLFAMPKSLCERILNDRSGEPMVIIAKAAGMPIAVLQRILLLVNPAVSHSVQRVYDLTDLYHDLDRGVARRLAAQWRAAAKPNDRDSSALPETAERKTSGLRDMSAAGLRSRFGALQERLGGVSARPDPGNAARRDLRSR